MKSIAFPHMFNRTNTNIVNDYYATLQNLKMLLWSEKGELFGDPYFGAGVRRYLFEQNDSVLKDILIDDIYTTIATFMPQLYLERKNIEIEADRYTVTAKITATNRANFQTNLYNIVLLRVSV